MGGNILQLIHSIQHLLDTYWQSVLGFGGIKQHSNIPTLEEAVFQRGGQTINRFVRWLIRAQERNRGLPAFMRWQF